MESQPNLRWIRSHGGSLGLSRGSAPAALPVPEVIFCSYRFLFRQFWPTLKRVWLPFALAAIALFFCLSNYLSGLMAFLAVPDPRVASRALGILAVGIFVVLFCYTIAAISVADLVSRRPAPLGLLGLRARRQEWLLYAAYLRLLLFLVLLVVGLSFLSAAAAGALGISVRFVPWVSLWLSLAATYWFFARAGFLLAPIASENEAASLRRTWVCSSGNFWRIGIVLFVLLIPGLVLESLGELALRVWNSFPAHVDEIPMADYVRFMGEVLPAWLALFTLSSFVTIVLLIAGSVAVYNHVREANPTELPNATGPRNSAGSVRPA